MKNLVTIVMFVSVMLVSGFVAAENIFCTKQDAIEAQEIFDKYKVAFDAGASSQVNYLKKENMLFSVLYCAGEMPKMQYCVKKLKNLKAYRKLYKNLGHYPQYVKANEYYFRSMLILKATCSRVMGE